MVVQEIHTAAAAVVVVQVQLVQPLHLQLTVKAVQVEQVYLQVLTALQQYAHQAAGLADYLQVLQRLPVAVEPVDTL